MMHLNFERKEGCAAILVPTTIQGLRVSMVWGVQSKRVQKNIDRRTSPWITWMIQGSKTKNNKRRNKNDTESTTLAEPPMFLFGVPTVIDSVRFLV